MANTHLAYPDLALEKFSVTDPEQDAKYINQLSGKNLTLNAVMHLETLKYWPSIHLGKEPSSLLCSEHKLLSGMRAKLRTLLHG